MWNGEGFWHLGFSGDEKGAHEKQLILQIIIYRVSISTWVGTRALEKSHHRLERILQSSGTMWTFYKRRNECLKSDVFEITELLVEGRKVRQSLFHQWPTILPVTTSSIGGPSTCDQRLITLRFHSRPCLLKFREICSSFSRPGTLERLLCLGHNQWEKQLTNKHTRKELLWCSFFSDRLPSTAPQKVSRVMKAFSVAHWQYIWQHWWLYWSDTY